MMKLFFVFVLAISLVGCSSGGDNNSNTPTGNDTNNTSNTTYDASKAYPVIIQSNLAQLAEVATITIADAGTQAPTALEFAPNGFSLAVGHSTGVTVFDLADLNGTPRTLAHTAKVNDMAWDSFGSLLVTASDDKTVKVWDMTTGEATLTITSPNNANFRHVAISNNDNLIAAAEDFSTIYILSATSGDILATFVAGINATIQDIAISADSTKLVVAADVVRVFDIVTGEEVIQFPVQLGVSNFVLASDDTRLFISTIGSGGLMVVDITTGEQILNQKVQYIHPRIALSADGQLLVGFWNFQGAKMAFYDTSNLQPVGTEIALQTGSIDRIAYGSDGSMIATVGMRMGNATLSIWRVNS